MFADFAHFGFPRRVCCLKSKTFVVKDRPFLPGTRQNPTRHSDRIGSPLSQGRTSVASHATDPLIGGTVRISEPAVVSNHISQNLCRGTSVEVKDSFADHDGRTTDSSCFDNAVLFLRASDQHARPPHLDPLRDSPAKTSAWLFVAVSKQSGERAVCASGRRIFRNSA